MPNYKEMYFELFRATEKAIRALEEGQRRCEEMYIEAEEPQLIVLDADNETEKSDK